MIQQRLRRHAYTSVLGLMARGVGGGVQVYVYNIIGAKDKKVIVDWGSTYRDMAC